MMNGWIKLHRKLIDNPIVKRSQYWHLWTFLLLKANHKESDYIWNNQKITLKPGQIITGRSELSRNTKIPESTVEKILKYLKTEQQIEQQTTTKFRIITIKNWDLYQDNKKEEQQKEQQRNNKETSFLANGENDPQKRNNNGTAEFASETDKRRQNTSSNVTDEDNSVTTEEQQRDTYKKGKNLKNKIYASDSDEFRLSQLLLSLILKRKPDFKKPDLQKWAIHIDRMIRLDHRKPERIEKVIRWSQADPFWQINVLCTEKLRERFDRLEMSMNKGDFKHGSGKIQQERTFDNLESEIGETIQV